MTRWGWALAITSVGLAAAFTTLTTNYAQEQTGAAKSAPVTFSDTRNMRFCEILIAKQSGIEIYNTTGASDCPPELWSALDTEAIRKQCGAMKVEKNGPHFWMMDSQTVAVGEEASFGGIAARWVGRLDPASMKTASTGIAPYTVFTPKKTQRMVYAKGKPVYELVDPEGHTYVLQAHEEQFPVETLASLGDRLKPPSGWQFRTRVLADDLVLDLTPDKTIYAIGDEYHQYWTRIP